MLCELFLYVFMLCLSIQTKIVTTRYCDTLEANKVQPVPQRNPTVSPFCPNNYKIITLQLHKNYKKITLHSISFRTRENDFFWIIFLLQSIVDPVLACWYADALCSCFYFSKITVIFLKKCNFQSIFSYRDRFLVTYSDF